MQVNLKWQKTDQLLPVCGEGEQKGVEGRDYPGHKQTFGMMHMFTDLIVVMVSQMHTRQIYQIIHFKC